MSTRSAAAATPAWQRTATSPGRGPLHIAGELAAEPPPGATVEARLVPEGWPESAAPPWQQAGRAAGRNITATLVGRAGGWWRLEVRIVAEGREIAATAIDHVGIGEVLVVAGQSNSANHGEERQTPQSGRVATFDGTAWRPAADPQPGASGGGGSFMPPLGDALVARLGVPVGFIAPGGGSAASSPAMRSGPRPGLVRCTTS